MNLGNAAALAMTFLRSPRRAAEAATQPQNLGGCIGIYAAFLIGNLLFYWLKPWDFPDANAGPPPESPFWFWLKIMLLWQPPFELLSILFLMGLVVWFASGRLPLRLVGAVAWAAFALFINIVAHAQPGGTSRPVFAAGALLAFGPFVPLLRRADRGQLRAVIAFMLGVSALGLVQLALMAVAAFLRSGGLFKAAQAGVAFWLLGAGTIGLKAITGLRMPRAFLALFLSMFFLIAAAFTLHLLGVPEEILKAALLYG